ncbi:hypothetical protein ScPMuIL_014843 [Solemya velum]
MQTYIICRLTITRPQTEPHYVGLESLVYLVEYIQNMRLVYLMICVSFPGVNPDDGYILLAKNGVQYAGKSVEDKIEKMVVEFREKKSSMRFPRAADTDPEWSNMWYLNGNISSDMTIAAAWESGLSGAGITIAVIGDGVELSHPDLTDNTNSTNSHDFQDGDNDPSPSIGDDQGTICAGLIAAKKDNNVCITGTAHGSTIIGVRLASGSGDRADALKHALDTVDIYTWGTGLEARPGTGFDVPGGEILDALQSGVTQGRGGKGAVYMSAAGDGGVADNCNTDGYASSIYTITITSLAYTQEPASYAEVCSPALAAAYGGGDGHDLITLKQIECNQSGFTILRRDVQPSNRGNLWWWIWTRFGKKDINQPMAVEMGVVRYEPTNQKPLWVGYPPTSQNPFGSDMNPQDKTLLGQMPTHKLKTSWVSYAPTSRNPFESDTHTQVENPFGQICTHKSKPLWPDTHPQVKPHLVRYAPTSQNPFGSDMNPQDKTLLGQMPTHKFKTSWVRNAPTSQTPLGQICTHKSKPLGSDTHPQVKTPLVRYPLTSQPPWVRNAPTSQTPLGQICTHKSKPLGSDTHPQVKTLLARYAPTSQTPWVTTHPQVKTPWVRYSPTIQPPWVRHAPTSQTPLGQKCTHKSNPLGSDMHPQVKTPWVRYAPTSQNPFGQIRTHKSKPLGSDTHPQVKTPLVRYAPTNKNPFGQIPTDESTPLGQTCTHKSNPLGQICTYKSQPLWSDTHRRVNPPLGQTCTHKSNPLGSDMHPQVKTPLVRYAHTSKNPFGQIPTDESTPLGQTCTHKSNPLGQICTHKSQPLWSDTHPQVKTPLVRYPPTSQLPWVRHAPTSKTPWVRYAPTSQNPLGQIRTHKSKPLWSDTHRQVTPPGQICTHMSNPLGSDTYRQVKKPFGKICTHKSKNPLIRYAPTSQNPLGSDMHPQVKTLWARYPPTGQKPLVRYAPTSQNPLGQIPTHKSKKPIGNNLTWRDVQHLIVQTSKMNGTGGTEGRYDWVLNGAGLYVSHRLGFGLLDASALVTAAKTWENVPEQKQCNTDNLEVLEYLNFTHMSQTTMEIIGCSVKYLEHVKIGITFDVTWAGALELKLTSPKKTESYLLTERPNDETRDQTRLVLEFMSAHFWGENTEGSVKHPNWNLTAKIVDANSTGYIHSWHLQLYGTEAIPNPYPRDDCGRPKLVAHADILGDDTSYGSTLTYQCHTGYTPTGGDTIVCLAYGVWSRRTYSCPKVDCMSPAPMMNAQLRLTTTTYGSTAIYTCDTGYVLHNDTVTCLETGEWSALDDTCTIANCGTPSAVLHADFEVTNTTYLSNATYSCVIGYNTSVSSVVVCQDTEKWTAPTLTCTIVDCGEPHGGANMTLQFSNTTYSSTVSAACHAGYVPSGSDTSVCQEDGTWSVLSLTCTYVECGIPQEQDYMQVEVGNVTFDSVATYRCSNRFMTSGNGTVTCQSNGHWSKLALRCDGGTACRNWPSLLIWVGVLLACFLSGALFV